MSDQTAHGRIEIDCTICRARVSVPIPTDDGVELAATQALELSLYHRTRHHEGTGSGPDPAVRAMASQVAVQEAVRTYQGVHGGVEEGS